MAAILVHEGRTFTDQVVYFGGQMYVRCRFDRCTLVLRDVRGFQVHQCSFSVCVWHIDLMIMDADTWKTLTQNIFPLIKDTLPHAVPPAAPVTSNQMTN